MDEQRKTLNLGLTIITLMAMIAAGSFIVKIPDSLAFDDGEFYIIPKDQFNNTIGECEAVVLNSEDANQTVNFAAEINGTIIIKTTMITWDLDTYPKVDIYIIDNTNKGWGGVKGLLVSDAIEGLYVFTFCGYDPMLINDDQYYYCSIGLVNDQVEHSMVGISSVPSSISYQGQNGYIYLKCNWYACLFPKSYSLNELYQANIWQVRFNVYENISNQWILVDSQYYEGNTQIFIDNTGGTYDDIQWMDPYFSIRLDRTNHPPGDYRFNMKMRHSLSIYNDGWEYVITSTWGNSSYRYFSIV